jgi:hypothetical protein
MAEEMAMLLHQPLRASVTPYRVNVDALTVLFIWRWVNANGTKVVDLDQPSEDVKFCPVKFKKFKQAMDVVDKALPRPSLEGKYDDVDVGKMIGWMSLIALLRYGRK